MSDGWQRSDFSVDWDGFTEAVAMLQSEPIAPKVNNPIESFDWDAFAKAVEDLPRELGAA